MSTITIQSLADPEAKMQWNLSFLKTRANISVELLE